MLGLHRISRRGEKSFKIHNTEKKYNVYQRGRYEGNSYKVPHRFFSWRIRKREETVMLAIFKQNLLRTQVSTINSSADQPAGDLATRVTVLLAPPAVTKTKRSLGSRITNKTNKQKSKTLKQRIQVILLVFLLQYIQIDWGGGSYGHISQRAIKKTKQNHKK